MKKNKGRKPVGNSGLYGRVTKKQMGGAAKPVGMSGPGFLAGEIPPDGSGKKALEGYFDYRPSENDMKRIKAKKDYYESLARNEGPVMRTNDFQDANMNGIDDRDEKKRPPTRSGPRTEKDPRARNRRSMPSREELQSIADAMSGKAITGGGRRRGGMFDRLRDQARRRTESPYEPKMPGGGRQTPPMTGPNPDVGKMFPRRIEGLGATLVDALGIKSQGMGDRKRKEPPRPSPKRGSMTRQRRR